MDSLMSPGAFHDARLVFHAVSDSVFGIFDTITLIIGSEQELYTHHLPIPASINHQASFRLDSLLHEAMQGDTLDFKKFIFLRSELKTRKHYGVQSGLYCTTIQEFHSYTNPVWISIQQPLVSVNENDDGEFFSLFPNPAREQINIDFFHNGTFKGNISIFDYTGRLMFTEQISSVAGMHTVDISQLAPGLYFLKAYGKQHCSAKSFIRN
jgi:hypothetical protein